MNDKAQNVHKIQKSSQFLQYDIIQSKLGKFKNTKLQIKYFRSSNQIVGGNQRSKQMISADQNRIFRIHKIKCIKLMSDKDYLLSQSDFEGKTDPYAIKDLKQASYKQLKEVMIIQDYVFCSLLQSSRLTCIDPVAIQGMAIGEQEEQDNKISVMSEV